MIKRELKKAAALTLCASVLLGMVGCEKKEIPTVDASFIEGTEEESTEETVSSVKETSEEESTEEVESDLINEDVPASISMGYADIYNGLTYFRQYGMENMEEGGLFGEVSQRMEMTPHKVMSMATDGSMTYVCDDFGFGNFYVQEGFIYSQERDSAGFQVVYKQGLDGYMNKVYDTVTNIEGRIGNDFICSKNTDDGLFILDTATDEVSQISSEGFFITVDGTDCFLYRTEEDGSVIMEKYDSVADSLTELGKVSIADIQKVSELYSPEYDYQCPICTHVTGKYVVTLIGFYSGSGHFFNGGAYFAFDRTGGVKCLGSAPADTDAFICVENENGTGIYYGNYEGEITSLIIEGNPGEVSLPYNYITNGECTFDSESGNIYLVEKGSGEMITMVSKAEYEEYLGNVSADWEDTSFDITNMDYVDGKIFFTTVKGKRNASQDIGWRYYFDLTEATDFCKNLKTGKITILNQYGPSVE